MLASQRLVPLSAPSTRLPRGFAGTPLGAGQAGVGEEHGGHEEDTKGASGGMGQDGRGNTKGGPDGFVRRLV